MEMVMCKQVTTTTTTTATASSSSSSTPPPQPGPTSAIIPKTPVRSESPPSPPSPKTPDTEEVILVAKTPVTPAKRKATKESCASSSNAPPVQGTVLIEQPGPPKSRRRLNFEVCSLPATDRDWMPIEAGLVVTGQILAALVKAGFTLAQSARVLAIIINWPPHLLKEMVAIIGDWPDREIRMWAGPVQSLLTGDEVKKSSINILSSIRNLRDLCNRTETFKNCTSMLPQTK